MAEPHIHQSKWKNKLKGPLYPKFTYEGIKQAPIHAACSVRCSTFIFINIKDCIIKYNLLKTRF